VWFALALADPRFGTCSSATRTHGILTHVWNSGILPIPGAPQSADLAVIGRMTLACVIADLTRRRGGSRCRHSARAPQARHRRSPDAAGNR
jgi:hypothetical protein